jgi:hypothetical protein
MDSFDMPAPGVDRLRLRWVRFNPEALDTPGAFYIMGLRDMGSLNIVQFPARLQYSIDGVLWHDVDVVINGVDEKGGAGA